MFTLKTSALAAFVGIAAVSLTAQAGVTDKQAAQLGQTLTPVGAKKAGDVGQKIPNWTGGLVAPPAGYVPNQHYLDPYADDQPLYTIDRSNYQQHKEHLAPGQTALFAAYDSYKMPVYPSHRSAAFPPEVYDATRRNATQATLDNNFETLRGAATGFPFPIPQNGAEAIWNHKTRYRGAQIQRSNNQALVNQDGNYLLVKIREKVSFNYGMIGQQPDHLDNLLLYLEQEVISPPRLSRGTLKVYETLDQVADPRTAWNYNQGMRRLKKVPNLSYDNPGTASQNLRTTDQFDMFNGALDRYNWRLGLRPMNMLIPYNAYRLQSNTLRYDDIIKPRHINQDHSRYELHRVRVVTAELKGGIRHIYKKRVFYLDEDSWQIVFVELYDNQGNLWRVQEAHTYNMYNLPAIGSSLEAFYDLQNGRYLAGALCNEDEPPTPNVQFD